MRFFSLSMIALLAGVSTTVAQESPEPRIRVYEIDVAGVLGGRLPEVPRRTPCAIEMPRVPIPRDRSFALRSAPPAAAGTIRSVAPPAPSCAAVGSNLEFAPDRFGWTRSDAGENAPAGSGESDPGTPVTPFRLCTQDDGLIAPCAEEDR